MKSLTLEKLTCAQGQAPGGIALAVFLLSNLFKPYSTLTLSLKLTLERRLTELLVVELWLVYRVRRPVVDESCKEFT